MPFKSSGLKGSQYLSSDLDISSWDVKHPLKVSLTSSGKGSLGDENRKGKAQSDRKRLSKIIFLFNPFLTHTKKWNVKVWPRARGLDSGLPHATAEARPSPSKPPRSLRARDGRGPRGAEPQDPHARTPHLGAGPSSLSPRPPQAVPPTQSLCPPRPSREPRPQAPLTA